MGANLGKLPDYEKILTESSRVEVNYEPIPISPIYSYDSMVKSFYDFIKDNDIKRILPVGIKSEYIDSVLTFKKRYIRIRQLQDAVPMPCVICKSSLADTEDRMFQNDIFNCDISNNSIASRIHPKEFADTIIDIKDKLFFGATPRNAALNVEISVLDDSEQKMDNVLLMWDRIRFRNLPFDMACTTKNILPVKQALLLAYHLGFFEGKDLSTIPKTNYVDIYNFLNLHISPECPFYLIYEKDTSTSHMEIVLCFNGVVEVQPEVLNKSNDRNLETSHDRTLITRPFTIYFNTISFMYFWIPKSKAIDSIIDDLILNLEKPEKIEVAKDLIETNFGEVLDYNSEPIPQYIDKCSLYTECDFDIERLEDLADIDCSELLDIRATAYIEYMQSVYPESRWHEFYDVRIDSEDEFTINYKTLHISITPKTLKIKDIFKIAIYINKSEMDYFLNR